MNKPYFAEGTEAMVALEAMVDRVGLRNVVYALEHICGEKAEHLNVNWQDGRSGIAWHDAAEHLHKAALKIKTDA